MYAALYQPMGFHAASGVPMLEVVRMYVNASGGPDPSPRSAVDEYDVTAPIEPARAPSPGTKCGADHHAEAKADAGADGKSRARGGENDGRVVIGDADKRGIRGQYANVRTDAADDWPAL